MKTFKTYITEARTETNFLVDTVYSKYIDEHDKNSVECVGWMDGTKNSLIRFQKIYEGGIGDDDSILDVGCGVAHLHTYLKNQGWNGKYLGFDPNKKAIDMIDEDINAMHGTIEDLPDFMNYDWAISSGVFNLGLTEDLTFSIIHNMISHANKGIIFNMLNYPYRSIPLEGHDNITYESYSPDYVRNKLLEYDNDRIEITKNYMEDDAEFTVYFYKENK
jgi:SAM-dependent methyltransferase